jgi:hypothetical protein
MYFYTGENISQIFGGRSLDAKHDGSMDTSKEIRKKIYMKDLEPILNVLCNYKAGYVLGEDELLLLREWLAESVTHEDLFNSLNTRNGMQFIMGSIEGNIREKIQMKLIEIEEGINK